jgi:hypothetical protein
MQAAFVAICVIDIAKLSKEQQYLNPGLFDERYSIVKTWVFRHWK